MKKARALTIQEENVLLSVLHLGENAYLITIRDYLKEKIGKEFAIAAIFVPLDRLWKLGYLTTSIKKPSPKVGGRSIKYYRITEEGINILSETKKVRDIMWLDFADKVLEK